MKLLLDTHAFLWMSLNDPQLSETARDVIADLENIRGCSTLLAEH